jgi:hypothetical protein
MHKLITGFLVGSLLTAGVGAWGGTFYDSSGAPSAPTGSIQSFDYFRARGAMLDIQRLERGQEQDRIERLTKPCAR